MNVGQVTRLLGPAEHIDRWPKPQAERQRLVDLAHSQQLFGLTRSEYLKMFPPFPREGVTWSWDVGRNVSDCDGFALRFVNDRVVLLFACDDAQDAQARAMGPLRALVDRLFRYRERYGIDNRGRGLLFGRPKLDLVVVGRTP